MANAYATIADGGMHHDWFVVSKVTQASNGEVALHARPQKTNRAVTDPDIAADASYAMQQVVKAGTGANAQRWAARPPARPAPPPTTTATSSSSWFVGYTPQVATAVMYVRGNGRKPLDGCLPSYFGADYPHGHLGRHDECADGGPARRGLPAAGEPRRHGAVVGPRPVHPAAAEAEEDQDTEADADPDGSGHRPRARHRARARRRRAPVRCVRAAEGAAVPAQPSARPR